MAAKMRYRSTPRTPKVTDAPKPVEVDPGHHSGLVPIEPPKPAGGNWSVESYPYADPKLADPQVSP